MTGPIDLAALAHHEETVFIVEYTDARIDVVRQRENIPAARALARTVDFIGKCLPAHDIRVNRQYAVALAVQRADSFVGVRQRPAVLRSQVKQVLLRAIAVRHDEGAARKIVKRCTCQALHGDVIVLITGSRLGVVGRRSRVVQRHAGDDADLFPRLFRVFGYELQRRFQIHIVVDDAGERFFSRRHRGCGRGGVRAEGRGIVGRHHAQIREAGEAQLSRNGVCRIRILDRTQVILRGCHLRVPHAVANEHKHILGRGGTFRHRQSAQCNDERKRNHNQLLHDDVPRFFLQHMPEASPGTHTA